VNRTRDLHACSIVPQPTTGITRFIALRRYCVLFLQIEGSWQPCVEPVYRRHFRNSMCSLRVSVSNFGTSCNISNFFIIIIFYIYTPILKGVLFRVKFYQTASHATEKSFVKGGVNRIGKLHCCLILRNCHSNHHPDQSEAINIETRPYISKKITTRWKLRWCLTFFCNKVFLIKVCIFFFGLTAIAHLIDYSIV
jgi:hypothetical protein